MAGVPQTCAWHSGVWDQQLDIVIVGANVGYDLRFFRIRQSRRSSGLVRVDIYRARFQVELSPS